MAQFLNPFNLAPKLPDYEHGPLAGILRNEQRENYEKLMNQSMLLQQMGIQEQALGLSNKIKDVPLMDMKRQDEKALLDARRPYIGQLAAGEAEDKLRGYDFNRQTHNDKVLATLSDYKTKIGDNKWKEETRSLEITADLVNRASQMGPQGLDYIKTEMDRLEKLGYKIPASVANPESWPMLQNAFKNTLPHIRALEAQAAKDKEAMAREKEQQRGALERTNIQEGGANARANARLQWEKKREEEKKDQEAKTGPQAAIKAMNILNNPRSLPEDVTKAKDYLRWFSGKEVESLAKQMISDDIELLGNKLTPAQKEARVNSYVNSAQAIVSRRYPVGVFGGREPGGPVRRPEGGTPQAAPSAGSVENLDLSRMTPEQKRKLADEITARERGLK